MTLSDILKIDIFMDTRSSMSDVLGSIEFKINVRDFDPEPSRHFSHISIVAYANIKTHMKTDDSITY